MQLPDLYHYDDYRQYLRDYAQARKAANPRWTLSAWAKSLGLAGTASLTMILNGKRRPSLAMARKLSKSVKLPSQQESFFLDLVNLERFRDQPEVSEGIAMRVRSQKTALPSRHISAESFALISSWYCSAIREMTNLRDFSSDVFWIASRLSFPVSPSEIKKSLKALQDLKMIVRTGNHRWCATAETVQTTQDIASQAIRKHHADLLKNAGSSLAMVDVSKREFLGATITLKERDIPHAKALLRKFQKEFNDAFDQTDGDQTYQLGMQFFPLTRSIAETKSKQSVESGL